MNADHPNDPRPRKQVAARTVEKTVLLRIIDAIEALTIAQDTTLSPKRPSGKNTETLIRCIEMNYELRECSDDFSPHIG